MSRYISLLIAITAVSVVPCLAVLAHEFDEPKRNRLYRQRLMADATFYVRTDGSDSNDGSANDAGHAFGSLSGAWRYLVSWSF